MNVRTVQLGEVCEFIRGVTFDKSEATTTPEVGKIPILRAGNIGEDLDAQNDLVWVPESLVSPEQHLRRNDIAICMSSGSPEVVGKTARAPRNLHASVGSFCGLIRPKNADQAAYLSFFFRSPAFYEHRDAIARGANIQNLRFSQFEEIDLEIPDNQQRVAEQLEQADRLRRTRRYALELSDSFLPAAFLELFGDPVQNPKGWKKRPLGEISGIRRGASPRPIERFLGGSVPWIKIGDGTKGDQIYIASTEDHVTEEGAAKSVFLKKGALIFANCGVSCGFARILKIDGCIHDGWLAFSDFEEVLDPIFFLQGINQITLHLRSLAPEGTQPNLNTGIMGKFPMILPPLEMQRHFAALVARHEHLRVCQREELRQAEHLFQCLLDRAFSAAKT